MEYSQANDAADELEVIQMLVVNSGVRVYLQSIIIVSRVFEQTVERIEHFVR